MNKKILLFNPPGKQYYMRDYYCSKISKAAYYYHPIDFVFLSGILSVDFKVSVLDCIAEKIGSGQARKKIAELTPDIVIFLTGIVSWPEDLLILEEIKKVTDAFLVGLGDVFLNGAKELLEKHDFIDAALLDFTTDDIVRFLRGKDSDCRNLVYRKDGKIIEKEEQHEAGFFSIPSPRHELFSRGKYIYPFTKKEHFATIMTDFGCPFRCAYCVVNRFRFKEREIPEVIRELAALNKQGIEEIVFKDQTFAAHPERAKCLCREILENKIRIGWTCFSRPDLMDEELLFSMKGAGCHTIIFGIETINQDLLTNYHRNIDLRKIKKVFGLCKEAGIETVGTFILGLPGDNEDSIRKTIAFSKEIGCDYASFNIFTPAFGTEIREKLVREGVVSDALVFMDSGISYPVFHGGDLKPETIWSMRKEALRTFYLDPLYALKKMSRCHSISNAKNLIRQAGGILKTLFYES